MKKLLLVAFAFVMGLSQCAKQRPVMPNYNGPAGDKVIQHVAISASHGNGDSKLNIETGIPAEVLKLTWTDDDVIKVFQVIGGKETEVSEDGGLKLSKIFEGGEQAEFEGEIIATSGEDLIFRSGVKPTSDKFYSQTGKLEDFKGRGFLCVEGKHEYVGDGNYNVTMGLTYAVLKLDLSAIGTESGTTVTITEDGTPVASVMGVKNTSKELYVAVPAPNEYVAPEKELISKAYGFDCDCDVIIAGGKWALVKNTFYTDKVTPGASIKIAPAVFSVDSDKTVWFSKGNLYWDNGVFKFEANQWDYRTWENENSYIGGTYSETGTPSGNCGLFGWSTDGAAGYGTGTSLKDDEYSDTFVDWGCNSINGGNPNRWSTLSKDEWSYLLGRTNSSRTNASLCAWKELDNTHKGFVILPDNTDDDVMNSITSTADLAAYGAVFLPAAGNRYANIIANVGTYGTYWSSTFCTETIPEGVVNHKTSYMMQFGGGDVTYLERVIGRAVRLVR